MNVRLGKNYNWLSGLVWDGEYMINAYEIQLQMITNTADPELQNLAYNRLNYWIHSVMQDSVLLGQENELGTAFQATGQRVITLPEEPVDQLVGMMLYCKLNSIMHPQITITDLAISSRVGDDMIYHHSAEEALGPFAAPGWWQDAGPRWSDAKAKKSRNNVIAINRIPEWKDLDLEWGAAEGKQNSDVLFAQFRKDEDQ